MIARDVKNILLGGALLLAAITPASAANLLFSQFINPQTFDATGPLKLFKSGSFFQSFFVNAADTVMISFSAVCSTTGTAGQYTSIQITIDGTAVYPTNLADDVFCSAVGATGHTTGWARSTLTTAVRVGANSHTVQVNVTPHNGGQSRIDNLSLLVWD